MIRLLLFDFTFTTIRIIMFHMCFPLHPKSGCVLKQNPPAVLPCSRAIFGIIFGMEKIATDTYTFKKLRNGTLLVRDAA